MIFFGPFSFRRRRTSRVGSVRETSLWSKLRDVLADRAVLLRLWLCFLAIAGLLAAVEAWRAPFTPRLGDHNPQGRLAQIPFRRINRFETERAQSQAEDQVPFVFRLEAAPLHELLATLSSDLNEVARAESLESLRSNTRAVFSLSSDRDQPMPDKSVEEQEHDFKRFRAGINVGGEFDDETLDSLQTPPDENGQRVAAIMKDLAEFLKIAERRGIVDPFELHRHKIRSDQKLEIVRSDSDSGELVSPADVLLSELLHDEALLGGSWTKFPRLAVLRPQLERWLELHHGFLASLKYDSSATQHARREARQKVPLVTNPYSQGDVLVMPGQVLDETSLELLRDEYEQIEEQIPPRDRIIRLTAVFVLILVLASLIGYYLAANEPRITHHLGPLTVYLAAVVLTALLGRLLSFDPWRAEIIPLMVTVMILAIAYQQELAAITAFTLSLLLTLSTVGDTGQFVVLMSVSATAIAPLTRVSSRSSLIKIGFWCGVVYLMMTWGVTIVRTQSLEHLWTDRALWLHSLRGAGWCLAAGYIVAGSLPFIEAAFGIVTDISLLELSHVSHPLLQELVRRAPGTYNHSIAVASLAEAAAEKIEANGLLVRVGAYFHDIGKMLKPGYFVENMGEETTSKHAQLNPTMSTLIIVGHVKDGVDLALQYNLPKPIIDFIEQHHGTTLVQFFYHAASKKAEQDDTGMEVEESSFRYPGPKPQTREAGLLMLSDAVESASRTLTDPTSKRIESLVRDITLAKLLDGQFEESTLTLSEINQIQDSLTTSLISIHHTRIRYPEQRAG